MKAETPYELPSILHRCKHGFRHCIQGCVDFFCEHRKRIQEECEECKEDNK